jgi:hypothetical protein
VLVEHVGGAGAAGDRLADDLGADAARDHGARPRLGLGQRAPQRAQVRAPAQVHARGRDPRGAQVAEQRALVVQAQQPHLLTARGERRDQRRPLPLGTATLHVRRHEQEAHQRLPRRWVASTSRAWAAGR